MLKESNKVKILSASAVALLALTGTAYGTGVLEGDSENESYTDSEIVEQSQDLEVNEAETPEDGEEETPVEEDEQGTVEGEEETPVEDEQETEEGAEESNQEEEDKQEEVEEVDESKVVPLSELPIDEETGLLDFPEYHKIAKGRALPRPLTEEEKEYFDTYVEEGQYEEVRTSVTAVEYKPIYVYEQSFYKPEGSIQLKFHKYKDIKVELLMLDEQQSFLDEQQKIYDEFIEYGYEYDEKTGEFMVIDDEEVPTFDELDDEEVYGDEEYTENENPIQSINFEDKEIYDDLNEYNTLTEEEFKSEYGFNFIYRAVVEEGDFTQKEIELPEGLTLVMEAESLKDGSEEEQDTIVLRWAVVRDVVRFNSTIEYVQREGQYNLIDNPNVEGYVQGNIRARGFSTLWEDGKYTPAKIFIDYVDSGGMPQLYKLIAEGVHVGEDNTTYRDIVAFIEYGIDFVTGDESPDLEVDEETDIGIVDPDTDKDKEDGEDGEDKEDVEGNEDGEDNGEGSGNLDGRDPEESEGKGEDGTQTGGSSGTKDTSGGKETEESEKGGQATTDKGRFQQTGATIVWGSILSGLGLGALGTFFYKKSKKEDKDDGDEE